MDTERIAKLEAQVEGIKEDVADVKQDIKELHSRITTGNREVMDYLDTKIGELAKADKAQHDKMSSSIDGMKDRVGDLEKWRWMIVGGAVAVGYIIGHLQFFEKVLK